MKGALEERVGEEIKIEKNSGRGEEEKGRNGEVGEMRIKRDCARAEGKGE